MPRAVRLLSVCVLLGAALAALPALTSQHVALADDVTIDDTCDETEFDAALATAHLDGGGTIDFDCPANTTITFTSEKDIDADITIDGGGEITLDGNNSTRLFSVLDSDDHLTLRNITLQNGNAGIDAGGAINNNGTVTVTNSTFSGNVADVGGAIFNDGTLTVTNATFSGNVAAIGDAIYNVGGTLTVTDSTFPGNSAGGSGGAIVNILGTLTVTNSTFSGSSAAGGGAIFNVDSTLTVTSSTFSGNDGDAISNVTASGVLPSKVTVTSSTFSGNTGNAIRNDIDGDATVTASVLVDNGGNCGGPEPVTSGGYNLTDDTSCNLTGTGDIQNGDANLGPLADNGGPTQTMLPIAPSDAIDAIPTDFCSANLPATDQRGVARPQLSGCDIGAVEITFDEIPDHALCANRYNGDLRMPRRPSCASTEVLLTLPDDGPIDVCVNRYNGDARYSRTGRCASTETLIEVVGDFTQPVCVNRYNGDLRVPRRAGQCASTEVARLI